MSLGGKFSFALCQTPSPRLPWLRTIQKFLAEWSEQGSALSVVLTSTVWGLQARSGTQIDLLWLIVLSGNKVNFHLARYRPGEAHTKGNEEGAIPNLLLLCLPPIGLKKQVLIPQLSL